MAVDVESVCEALRTAGFGPDLALVRVEWNTVTVTLREDRADTVREVLAARGIRATAAGSRAVLVAQGVDEPA